MTATLWFLLFFFQAQAKPGVVDPRLDTAVAVKEDTGTRKVVRAQVGDTTVVDALEGFRGVPFGSADQKRDDFFFYEKDGDTTVYRRSEDLLRIYGVPVDEVYYVYWKDQFLGGVALCHEAEDCLEPLFHVLQPMLGDAIYEEANNRFTWNGKTSSMLLKIESDGTGRLMIFGRDMVLAIKESKGASVF